jgi:hypothetical protein
MRVDHRSTEAAFLGLSEDDHLLLFAETLGVW